nr:hypothetical protein [Tanacetum cinerariifolium]
MSVLVKHDLEGYEFEKICINGKSLSEIQLEHEMEDEFKVVVVNMVHECRDYIIVVKEIVSRLLEEEEVSHFGKEVMILEWDEEGDGGSKVSGFNDLNNGNGSITWQSMVCMKKDAKDGLAKQENNSMRM